MVLDDYVRQSLRVNEKIMAQSHDQDLDTIKSIDC
jgi:hypothetical protein